jgi:deoxyribodipyrimidine photolyase-related protein
MKFFLIFSTQLFDYKYLSDAIKITNCFFIIEDAVYFTSYKFHKLKLIFHRASMKYYYDYLKQKKIEVKYFDIKDDYFIKLKNHEIFCYDPVDNSLIKKLKDGCSKYNYKLTILETPAFITTHNDLLSYHKTHLGKKFMHDTSFYKWQKLRLGNLQANYKKIIKNKTYDKENREPFPPNQKEVFVIKITNNKYVDEAKKYVNKYFKDNWGDTNHFIYPITHIEAKKWLIDFVKNRINNFGKYEDAFQSNIHFGYHSVLSPLLNIGLLTDKDILDELLLHSASIPLNSLEGYIRQLIGWKQSMRYLYEFHFDKFYNKNYLNHKNKMPQKIWDANTGIPIVDNCIKKAYDYSYLHHIERLMVIGQFFLLTMINPKDVYDWFITAISIDSYEWVMIPNVYGMIMYADGGFMMSRPYFSSSNYLKKMNKNEKDKKAAKDENAAKDEKNKNFEKNKNSAKNKNTEKIKLSDGNEYSWDAIWDALYYNLINTHKDIFSKNYFIARNVKHWDKKTISQKKDLLNLAKLYINYLNS